MIMGTFGRHAVVPVIMESPAPASLPTRGAFMIMARNGAICPELATIMKGLNR
jgi:hypothetical protein